MKHKIVFVITGLSVGGAENMLLKLLQNINQQYFFPYVICLNQEGELAQEIEALGVSVKYLRMKAGCPDPIKFFQLVWYLRQIQPDIVQTWMYHADLLGGLAARMAGVKTVVWSIRNSNLDQDKTKILTRLVVRVCAYLSHWIPIKILNCSETARKLHANLGYAQSKMILIPNGFDVQRFKPDKLAWTTVRNELKLTPHTPLVGVIGRYDPQKNYAGFLQAVEILHQYKPEVHYVLVGKNVDEYNTELLSIAESLGIREVIHLLGLRNDIPQLMASFNVFVSSSSYGEAFPNVLGEAMACGVPCAVTDIGDSAFIVSDTGRVVAHEDMAGLAAAIESLLSLPTDEWLKLGQKARERIETCFEISSVVNQYENFYLGLMGL
jgi:glycosyltransferase involved in cell wall biosynthesis